MARFVFLSAFRRANPEYVVIARYTASPIYCATNRVCFTINKLHMLTKFDLYPDFVLTLIYRAFFLSPISTVTQQDSVTISLLNPSLGAQEMLRGMYGQDFLLWGKVADLSKTILLTK